MQGLDTEILKYGPKNCSEIVYVLKTPFDPENLTKSGFLYQAISKAATERIFIFLFIYLFIYLSISSLIMWFFFLIASFDIEPVTTLKVVYFF